MYGNAPSSIPYAVAETGVPSSAQFGSSFNNHGLGPNMHINRSMEAFSSASSVHLPIDKGTLGKVFKYEGYIYIHLRNGW